MGHMGKEVTFHIQVLKTIVLWVILTLNHLCLLKKKTFFKNSCLNLNSFRIWYFIYAFQQNTKVAILMLIVEMKNYGSETWRDTVYTWC